ncbi:MAG TPA: hypothetical protein VKV19_01480 [Ktedonobacteraceae bacterium]|nr:hypothetical protein [Ktedonobacteraceae bacterium]
MAATVAAAAAAPAVHRGIEILVAGAPIGLPGKGERREQTAYLLAMTLRADHIVGVLVADQ